MSGNDLNKENALFSYKYILPLLMMVIPTNTRNHRSFSMMEQHYIWCDR